MHKLMLTAAAFGFMAAAAPAQADDDTLATPFYVGTGIGHVSVDRGSISLNGTQSGGIDGSGTSWSVSGGYYFTDDFGVELGYHDYGKPTAFEQTGFAVQQCPVSFSCPQISAVTAVVLGKLELVPMLDGILRLGVQEWNVGSPGGQFLDKTSGSAFIYGIGVSRHFDYNLNLDITYEHSSFSTGETRIGVSYSF
ncbi:MAG TPA: outer membrane beta-barrel protein [Gammaproteobacteria bacterium]|jgi:opacity protein-like surface antigen|nr:outer membrane beta-barrel protein [Gammaproteobacteria bacterium]